MWTSREKKLPEKKHVIIKRGKNPIQKNMWSSRLVIPDPSLTGLESRVRELEQVVAEKVGSNTFQFSISNCRNVSFAKMQCTHTKVWLLYRWGLLIPDNVHDFDDQPCFFIFYFRIRIEIGCFQVRTIREQKKMIEAQRGQIQMQASLRPQSKVVSSIFSLQE